MLSEFPSRITISTRRASVKLRLPPPSLKHFERHGNIVPRGLREAFNFRRPSKSDRFPNKTVMHPEFPSQISTTIRHKELSKKLVPLGIMGCCIIVLSINILPRGLRETLKIRKKSQHQGSVSTEKSSAT